MQSFPGNYCEEKSNLPISLIFEHLFLSKKLTVLAQNSVWEAEFSGSLAGVSSTILRIDFISACGLWAASSVVTEPWGVENSPQRSEEIP